MSKYSKAGKLRYNNTMIKEIPKSDGFTLIELVVSVGIFAIVMVMSVSVLLTIVDLDRKAQSMKSIMNNLGFALESMSRDIKVGFNYCRANPCTDDTFSFESFSGKKVTYTLSGTQLWRTVGTNAPVPLTAPEIIIENNADPNPFNHIPVFRVTGESTADNQQPFVVMRIKGRAGNAKTQTLFNIQTTVSQRLFDVP